MPGEPYSCEPEPPLTSSPCSSGRFLASRVSAPARISCLPAQAGMGNRLLEPFTLPLPGDKGQPWAMKSDPGLTCDLIASTPRSYGSANSA